MAGKYKSAHMRKLIYLVFDLLLTVLLTASYVPQIQLIRTRRSTTGITQSYILFTYLFVTAQLTLVTLYTCFGRLALIKQDRLGALALCRALVSLLQTYAIWLGSVCLYEQMHCFTSIY